MNPALHLGIEVFADQAPDLGAVLQFIGTMPNAGFVPNPCGGDSKGVLYYRGDNVKGYIELFTNERAIVVYVSWDNLFNTDLAVYLGREIPKLMLKLGRTASVRLVPCIGPKEKAHLLATAQEFPVKLEEALALLQPA